MDETLFTSWLSLERQNFDPDLQSEHLCCDNPFARAVAEPLFQAGVEVAAMACRKGYKSTRLHVAGCHHLTLLLQGNLSVQVDDTVIPMLPGDLAYCTPTTRVRFYSEPEEVTWWLYVKISAAANWEQLRKGGAFVEAYSSGDLMFVLLRRILDAYNAQDLRGADVALGDSHMLLRLLRRLCNRNQVIDKRGEALRNLVGDIAKEPAAPWSQAEMAERLCVSPRTLLRIFKREYGCAPLDMVIRQRLNRAMHLLATTDESLAGVAYQCGYTNVSAFSRTFHKQVGTTPGKYRTRARWGEK